MLLILVFELRVIDNRLLTVDQRKRTGDRQQHHQHSVAHYLETLLSFSGNLWQEPQLCGNGANSLSWL